MTPPRFSPSDVLALTSAHKWEIESSYLMCLDGFEREYWRGYCTACNLAGRWRFYRSQAQDDRWSHVVDVGNPDLTQVITTPRTPR